MDPMTYYEFRDGVMDCKDIHANSFVKTKVNKSTPIYNFYRGINIFITGASGFMGKVFIEKLLRCYPDVGGVYMLLRPKKNKTVESRHAESFEDELFDRVKLEQPGVLNKVHIIAGDLNEPYLGISQPDLQFMKDNIHVIVHAAASLRFDELIQDSFISNIRPTRHLLDIALECKKLKAFVHVSTLYTHCYLDEIGEEFYPNDITGKELEDFINISQTDEECEIIGPMLMGKLYNNTYAFTKAIGENVVKEYMDLLPLAMVRPSIVVSTWEEPIVGWTNNFYGPNGAAAGAALGVLRTFFADKSKRADLIPVDTATKMILSVIWKTACDKHPETHMDRTINPSYLDPSKQITPIYNLSTSPIAPLTWHDFLRINYEMGRLNEQYIASNLAVWEYSFRMGCNIYLFILQVWFLHVIPGMIMDFGLKCFNQEPRLMKIYTKIMKFSKYFYPYVKKDWIFHISHSQELLKQIPAEDYDTLDYSLSDFNWRDYFYFYFRGGKLYVLKDSYEHMEKARIHQNRIKKLHHGLVAISYCILAFVLYKIVSSYFNFSINFKLY